MCAWRVEFGSGNEEGDRQRWLRGLTCLIHILEDSRTCRHISQSHSGLFESQIDYLLLHHADRKFVQYLIEYKCAISSVPLTPIVTSGYMSR